MARELEYKYLCDGVLFQDAVRELNKLLTEARKFEQGTYVNSYFKTSGPAGVLRFSLHNDGTGSMTAKINDKNTMVDRIEYEHDLEKKHVSNMLELLEAALGEPVSVVFQFAEWHVDDVVISVVTSPEKPQWVFMEIEAQDMQTLNDWANSLKVFQSLQLKSVRNSMYGIFVNHEGVKF